MNNDKNEIVRANTTAQVLDLDEKWDLAQEIWTDDKTGVTCVLMRDGVGALLWLSDVAEGTELQYGFSMEGVVVQLSKETAVTALKRLRAASAARDGK
jgi:hypothetical protein